MTCLGSGGLESVAHGAGIVKGSQSFLKISPVSLGKSNICVLEFVISLGEIQMALAPLPENFRSEMARHRLKRADVCSHIGMNETMFSSFLNGSRPLPGWAAHNIGFGLNIATGLRVIDVDMNRGLVLVKPGRRRGRRYPRTVSPRYPSARK